MSDGAKNRNYILVWSTCVTEMFMKEISAAHAWCLRRIDKNFFFDFVIFFLVHFFHFSHFTFCKTVSNKYKLILLFRYNRYATRDYVSSVILQKLY
jgi:hypothetical protein